MFRLLGMLGGLSGAMDLGTGAPLDESLKRCVVAARLARSIGCTDEDVRVVMYASLLEHLGCTAAAHEAARDFGDDISVVRYSFLADLARPSDVVRTFVPGVSAGSGRSRARTLVTTLRTARDQTAPTATCEVARGAAVRLGLAGPVAECLSQVTTMWDGSGHPSVSGTRIALGTRIMHVAGTAVLFALHDGPAAAVDEVRRRAGSQLDPELAAAVSMELLDGLDEMDPLALVLELEPDPVRLIDDRRLEAVARTFGDLVDLKSVWLQGHSSAVAALAGEAAKGLGTPDPGRLRVAGYLHDIGRIAISARIWSKPGPLTSSERDQARLHPYYTERILRRVPSLGDVAEVAAQHHERCDGSGYHRGLRAADLSLASRVLAAADRYHSDVEQRPHRPALPQEAAARRLNAAAKDGRLDPDAVGAVLRAAGQRAAARVSGTAGLTDRQVAVLRLMARGLTNRQIAERLVISPRTAEHHVQDIYLRIGASTRAGAALFAMEHGLLDRPG